MENSFLYSKSISFLTGQTRRLSLSLSVRHYLLGPVSHCGPPVGHHFSLWPGPRIRGKIPQSPVRLLCSGLPAPQRQFWPPRHAKNLWMVRLEPPHPSLTTGVPLGLVAHRHYVMAAYVSGRYDRQLCHTVVMPGACCYTPTRAALPAACLI
jgi:hypothetical protein